MNKKQLIDSIERAVTAWQKQDLKSSLAAHLFGGG